MKKILLSAAAFSFLAAGNAQALLNYGFEEPLTAPMTIVGENWNNADHGSVFPNSSFNAESTDAPHTGAKALYAHVDPLDCGEDGTAECGPWQRVVALTNTGFGENKSYRVTLWAKGSGKVNVALLKGCFDHDKAPYDKSYDFTLNGEYTKQSFIFWAPSREVMTAQKADFAQDEYWNQDFLRLSFRTAGDYNIDDITIDESAVKKVTFNANTVCVEFAYGNNIATLAGDNGAELEGVAASVNVNGTDVEVRNVEAHADGKLYLFLGETELKKADVVKVSVTNAGPVAFNMGGSYEFTAEACPAITFAGEAAEHDQNLVVTAFADAEPMLIKTYPSDGSFEIDPTTKEFSFTFDHMIDAGYEDMKAFLNQEQLVLKTTESGMTMVFERQSTEDLVKGNYTLKIQGVATDVEYGLGMWSETAVATTSFEVGTVQVAQIIYTDLFTTLLSGENNGVPTNWTCYVKGDAASPWTGGEVWNGGSACRNLNVTDVNSQEYTAFYLCDHDGYTYLQYGDQEGATLTLPAGNIEFSVIALSHDDAGHSLEYRLEDLEGAEIATASGPCTVIANSQFTTIEAADYISVKMSNATAKQAILKIHAQGGGYTAVRVLGFRARSYEMTEGDVATSEVVLHEDFSSFGGNMPQEGSGYFCYNNNDRLAPGSGRNYTSGILNLGTGGMPAAFFARECGANTDGAHRITYGEEESGKELIFTAGAWDITYKSATWNDPNGNAAGTSKTYMELRDFTTGEVVYRNEHVNSTAANYMNGVSANPNVQADKVKSTFNTAGGKYILWIYGSTNTVVGDILIEKPDSKAVKYHTQLNKYLDEARAELVNSEDVLYDGTTKSALIAAVEKYSKVPNGMHTPEEYDAACEELENLSKALATRRATIILFKSDIEKMGEALANIEGTKYENLDIVPELQQFYNTYKEIDPSTLEDDELLTAQKKIAEGPTMVTNVVNAVNNFYTKQINNLLAGIAANAEFLPEDNAIVEKWIEAGQNAICDDQDVATELKKIYTAALYRKIAAGYNFQTYDEWTGVYYPDSLELTGYIANNMMYTITDQKDLEGEAANAAFPGWNITEGTVSNVWWYESPLNINASNPAVDASIHNDYVYNGTFKVNQVLDYVPAGTYTLTMKTADCSNIQNVSQSYVKKDESLPWSNSFVYAVAGADSAKVEANYGEGQVWRNAATTTLTGICSALESGEYTITMTIGADMNCYDHGEGQVDDTYLYMTGKLEGFDYEAAAEALLSSLKNLDDNVIFYQTQNHQVLDISAADFGAEIHSNTYYNGIGKITFTDTPTMVGARSFSGSNTLTSIDLPASVATIEEEAFSGCTALSEIICRSPYVVTCEDSGMEDIDTRQCKLFIPQDLIQAYLNAPQWSNFLLVGTIEGSSKDADAENRTHRIVRDGIIYQSDFDQYYSGVTYQRDFQSWNWEAICLPFSLPFNEWNGHFKAARINAFHQYDDDADGVIDRSVLEAIVVKNGSLNANTPYLIRTRTSGEHVINLYGAVLSESDANTTIDCSTVSTKFNFIGNYETILGSSLSDKNAYTMSDGILRPVEDDTIVPACRWYMTVENRTPDVPEAPQIHINVIDDEEGNVNCIETIGADATDVTYSIDGRQINRENFQGVVILNGKKTVRN